MGTCTSQESRSGEVRIKHSLNKEEESFVVKRRKTVLKSLIKLKIPCSKDAVPNIALLGSGGGQRAMVGLLGSLVQLDKAGLLDCILYLSGVSGSTWCMASLYREPDWSTKLETVKDQIIRRLSGPAVSWGDAFAKLKKYYYEKDIFSLTDFWAAIFVTTYIKEIDEHRLTGQRNKLKKDPFPIYTAIDKQCKQNREGDPWFEISPLEAGYSLTGAFVKTSSFGSQFDNGRKIKTQPEMDMLYLQALCGSALADGDANISFIWQSIKGFISNLMSFENEMIEGMEKDPNSPPAGKCSKVLMDLVDMNLSVLNGIDPFDLHESIRTNMNDLTGGKDQHIFQMEKLNLADKEAAILHIRMYTLDICACLRVSFNFWPFDVCFSICRAAVLWIWGRKYDFLQNMTDKTVPRALLKSETRDYIDAGVLQNSPYFSVLREERDIDLIISLDFSDGDPFMTVKNAAKTCRKLKIPFPVVNIPNKDEKKPKDFYVFKAKNAPTVIHIPLFNVVNCGDDIETWRNKYKTFRFPYNAEEIAKLMEFAGRNITNNRAKLLKHIRAAIGQKT
ncbi:cytosolic phospholipase A2 gamma-like [Carassius auratus]|uniref:Cytosolic phospholipase A2 gamma-like n=1 Tax=Carassius auratus TaxID=7957 RepID=A0A6P6MRN9_CARAU|nr:cytosolic phospholipase A2 gamma-like [Carassius auratus]